MGLAVVVLSSSVFIYYLTQLNFIVRPRVQDVFADPEFVLALLGRRLLIMGPILARRLTGVVWVRRGFYVQVVLGNLLLVVWLAAGEAEN